MNFKEAIRECGTLLSLGAVVALALLGLPVSARADKTADVVALDQPFFYNRLGAVTPDGMIFALKRDVIDKTSGQPCDKVQCAKGNVQLRSDKRPRPIVLRMNVGDTLTIKFTNLLAEPLPANADHAPATRTASIHVMGMQLVGGIGSDGSNVGSNGSSLVTAGGSATYTFYAEREGTYLLYSSAATTGGEGDGGSLSVGLFGAVNVEPRGAEWYRSQVTQDDLELATKKDAGGNPTKTDGGQPILDYDAVYPVGHPRAGLPILKMTQGTEIVHSDLNAIITGPGKGRFPAGTYPPNPVYPDREQPFREFTTIFHDEIGAVQAFPIFEDPVFKFTLHSVRDGFAINYGAAGVGAEIVANRLGVGPMWDCVDCKFEEFFLTSWAVGDPAMVVDVPANATVAAGGPAAGAQATKALYPDDPSNVHHSYINDHVKFRNLHAGPKEHHIFHLHAHQWLHTPDSDNSTYLDSQAIGPGSGYTYEITYNGSGNRNKTVGDSIFHCHFYPHFAQGMWELWRSHDVFEEGTKLDADGRPAPGSRALPDAEILAGTPIPALVPMPGLAMAPMPGATVQVVNGQAQISGYGNPGYPFFIAGVAGHRPPTPPLDIVDDGGLPRHVITGGTAHSVVDRKDFSKELLTATAVQIPEDGTAVEKAAMDFHAERSHSSFTPRGDPASFITNGLRPAPGAPYADPCVNDAGQAAGTDRKYKAAVIQFDMKLNKAGWHFPQSRIITLWEDVAATRAGTRPPEPFFFRANTNDCITFYHTNLVPHVYEQDEFQVRTPTDVLGQHIHLVKFDVTSSDGSGNGWNYEDGTMSPDEIMERIKAINAAGGSWTSAPGGPATVSAQPHPYFGTLGARTTVQRWYADDVLNNLGRDRTLRTVFTHDHFGPSTHQQVGLYASLVIEPQGSTWWHNEQNIRLGAGRDDGGPTSWQARILTANTADSYREFLFQLQDFQLAYRPDGTPVNPPARKEVGLPDILAVGPVCPGGVSRPCPEAISADDVGSMTVNYRNEPIALRVRDPQTNSQAAGDAGDLSHVFRSNLTRADSALNAQPSFYPPLTGGLKPGDPFTALLRAYQNDKIQVRVQVGATEEGHNFSMNGVRWLFEPSDPNSGWRNSQMMGISEHFEFVLPSSQELLPFPTDYLYRAGSSVDDLWNGLWGLMRMYDGRAGILPDLKTLPNNPTGTAPLFRNSFEFTGICPVSAPQRRFTVVATTAQRALPGGTLVYNSRAGLHDPTAILHVRAEDLDHQGKLKPGVPIEPLILRANAGDCIILTLQNRLPATLPDLDGFSTMPMIVNFFNANDVKPSNQVGLHPQLLSYYIWRGGDGTNVGFNLVQTASPRKDFTYTWYAGTVTIQPDGLRVATPVELGAINLLSSDPIKHSNKGAIGAMIIQPKGSTWVEDPGMRAAATVTKPDGTSFREFVLLFQDDVNLRFADGSPVPNLAEAEDPEDSGQKVLNYRTEPLWARMGFAPDTLLEVTRTFDFTNVLSNAQVGGDPVTPVFTASPGTPVRFRVLQPGGHQRNHVFQVHGHVWQEEPYTDGSTKIGNNPYSEWKGSQAGHGPTNHFDAVLQNGAGGRFGIPGDYLYRDQASFQFDGGLWGIFRVTP